MGERTPRHVVLIVGSLILALAGCATGGSAPSVSSAAPTQAPTADPTPTATPEAMALNVGCDPPNQPCVLSAGTWVLSGRFSFILGMELTVPDGWQSLEQDAGEFNLFPLDHPNDHIFMVKDIAAITTDGTLQLVPDVPRTVEGLVEYWQHDPNLVVSSPEATTIADGIEAITFVITVSPDAQFTDPGCPVYPRCADFFTDPRYWDGGGYGIGAPAAVRMYMATIGSGYEHHVFVIGLEGEDEAALERLTAAAAPIIASIRLPDRIRIW